MGGLCFRVCTENMSILRSVASPDCMLQMLYGVSSSVCSYVLGEEWMFLQLVIRLVDAGLCHSTVDREWFHSMQKRFIAAPCRTVSSSEESSLVESIPSEVDLLPRLLSNIVPELRERLVAHRGFHCPRMQDGRPLEGTLAAYAAAWKAGIRSCECDVRLTADGFVVLSHDATLQKMAASPAPSAAFVPVANATLTELRTVGLLGGECVALLEEALELALSLKGRMVVELKPGAGVGRALAKLLRARPDLKDACELVMSFDLELLHEYVRDRAVDCLELSPLIAKEPPALLLTMAKSSGEPEYMASEQILDLSSDWAEVVAGWLAGGLDGVYVEWTPELTNVHAEQLHTLCAACESVGVWQTLGQTDHCDEAQQLLALGASYINTDLPREFFK